MSNIYPAESPPIEPVPIDDGPDNTNPDVTVITITDDGPDTTVDIDDGSDQVITGGGGANAIQSGHADPHIEIRRAGVVIFSTAAIRPTDRGNPDEIDPNIAAGIVTITNLSYESDADRPVVGSMSVTLSNAESVPNLSRVTDPLTATEVELFWKTGTSRMNVGVYQIDSTTATLEEDRSVTLDLSCRDAMQQFADVALVDPYALFAFGIGTDPVVEISKLINKQDPDAVIIATPWSGSPVMPPMSWEQGTTYLQIIQDIADTARLRVWIDEQGRYRIDPKDAPIDTVSADFDGFSTDDTQLLNASRTVQRSGLVNGVIVRGESLESGTAPVEARAWLDNGAIKFSDDPEFQFGVGPMPLVHVDRGITTVAQARELAEHLLRSNAGIPETVSLTIAANPRIVAGLSVPVDIPEIGATGTYRVSRTSMSREPAADEGGRVNYMTIVMQERRRKGLQQEAT